MIWRDGALPENAPSFPPILTYNLLSYGYGLLGHGLRLLEGGGNRSIAQRAFESSATALESAIARGQANRDRSFHRVVAAAAYHLGSFSARAFSLLSATIDEGETTVSEKALAFLMLRDLDGLEILIETTRNSGRGSDNALVGLLEAALGTADDTASSEVPPDLEDVLDIAISDEFIGAISVAMLAFERGETGLMDDALGRLEVGLAGAAEFDLITQWWTHRLAIHLLRGLWDVSFHTLLPTGPLSDGSNDWDRLRETFIASLFRRRKSEIDIWPSQLEAASRVLNTRESLVVSLPTSAGKTRIAELCILATLAEGKRVVFVSPLRALSAQTEAALQRTFAPLGKTVSSLYGSIGVSEVDEDILHDKDIVVATPEKLDFALRNDPALLDDVGLVVLDEGHMIGPGEREIRYEVQIQRLLRRPDAASRRIVCLSAVLPKGEKVEDFVGWITDGDQNGLIANEWRPTKLRFGEITWQGDHARLAITVGDEEPFVPRFLTAALPPVGSRRTLFPKDQQELSLAAAWQFVADGQTVLIYCPVRSSVEAFAKVIVNLNSRGALNSLLDVNDSVLATALSIGEEWFPANHQVLACLRLGVAIHHGSLPSPYRKEVEKLLQVGVLKVTVSSPTLAQGLNLSASTLIVHSLWRNKEMIKSTEFRNVVGRAGRAYIDLAGLVVYPMFDRIGQRRREWKSLVEDEALREMESGLVLLIVKLLSRMLAVTPDSSFESLVDYVAGTAAWEFPIIRGEDDSKTAEAESAWPIWLASLDTALLSLLSEGDVADDNIERALDLVLSSSLWSRSVARRTKPEQQALQLGLVSRATYVWHSSTPNQRRGYYLAGVGFQTGRALDDRAFELDSLLTEADLAISSADDERAIDAITRFAAIVFDLFPFAPRVLPENWRVLLASWLRGEAIASIGGDNASDVLEFIEGTLVYRLPWALEAVRVRKTAHPSEEDSPCSLVEMMPEEGLAVAAVETGSLNPAVAVLMRAGFASRSGSIKAVTDTGADFSTIAELYEWLRSDVVAGAGKTSDWPTFATHDLWLDFLNRTFEGGERAWFKRGEIVEVHWSGEYRPLEGDALRIQVSSTGESLVASADGDAIGTLMDPLNPRRMGLLRATATGESGSIELEYIGPADLR